MTSKHPRGVEVAKKLVKVSDLVVENFGTGVIERLGLGYEDLKKVKPDVIMLCSTGLGPPGAVQARHWLLRRGRQLRRPLLPVTGYKDGRPGQVAGIWADHLTGMLIVFAVLAALRHHRKHGAGPVHRDVHGRKRHRRAAGAVPGLHGERASSAAHGEPRSLAMAPHGVYKCDGFDKWVAIAVGSEEEWSAFCQATGHPEWAEDPRFADTP